MERSGVAPEAELSGDLEAVPVAQTLADLDARGACGSLLLFGDVLRGELVVCAPRVVDASTNLRRGHDAALRLLWLERGRFAFHERPASPAADAGWPIAALLREAVEVRAELLRLGSRAPSNTDRVEIDDPAAALAAFPGSEAWAAVVRDGRRGVVVAELAVELAMSTYACRAAIGRAAEARMLHVMPGVPIN